MIITVQIEDVAISVVTEEEMTPKDVVDLALAAYKKKQELDLDEGPSYN
jgi:hypothetical protein